MFAGSPLAGAPIAGMFVPIADNSSIDVNVGTAWLDLMLAEYWTASTIRGYLLYDGTAFDPEIDVYFGDIDPGDIASGPVTLTGKGHLNGMFTADNVVMPLGSGLTAQWFVIVRVDGADATSPIVVATDVLANDLPINTITGNGDDVTQHEFDIQALGLGRI